MRSLTGNQYSEPAAKSSPIPRLSTGSERKATTVNANLAADPVITPSTSTASWRERPQTEEVAYKMQGLCFETFETELMITNTIKSKTFLTRLC